MATIRMTFDEFTAQLPGLLHSMAPATGSDPKIQAAWHHLYEAAVKVHSEVAHIQRSKVPQQNKDKYRFLGWMVRIHKGFGSRPTMAPSEMTDAEVRDFLKPA